MCVFVCDLCKTLIISLGHFVGFPNEDYVKAKLEKVIMQQPRYSNVTCNMMVLLLWLT